MVTFFFHDAVPYLKGIDTNRQILFVARKTPYLTLKELTLDFFVIHFAQSQNAVPYLKGIDTDTTKGINQITDRLVPYLTLKELTLFVRDYNLYSPLLRRTLP